MTVPAGDIITLVEGYEVHHHHHQQQAQEQQEQEQHNHRRQDHHHHHHHRSSSRHTQYDHDDDGDDDGYDDENFNHSVIDGVTVVTENENCNGSDEMTGSLPIWTPTGVWWKDLLHFCGPGWLVSIAYVDPGNYQADIQAGGTTRYSLLWTIWWTSILSIYVQVLCVRLGYRTQSTLAQIQAKELKQYENLQQRGIIDNKQRPRRQQATGIDDEDEAEDDNYGDRNTFVGDNADAFEVDDGSILSALRKSWRRYFAWFVAEFSVVLTDLPEVIGFGIACNLFFGWPYWVGVICSLLTTMVFLATMNFGMRVLEGIIFAFVGVMSIALFVEMGFVGVDVSALTKGWVYGFVDATSEDLFAIVGILGAVVMPHNLYLHTGTIQTRKVKQTTEIIDTAIFYSSWEPALPIIVSFFVNMAVVAIAAERVFGSPDAANVGLTDFCQYFQSVKGGCILWGVALISAGQSSAITTTFTGQFIMDGYLELRLPVKLRAVVTRLVAITPCVLVAVFLPDYLNQLVNIVNASLAFLLPFALSPLIKYNCSPIIMGDDRASKGVEKAIMYSFGILAWLVNAISLSTPGGGFFGDYINAVMPWSITKVVLVALQLLLQIFYAWWNFFCLFGPVVPVHGGYSLGIGIMEEGGDGIICTDDDDDRGLGSDLSTSMKTSETELVGLT
mmetsp:Transcript_39361/g.95206  ORF Transcript_39361/g.95206 Transcript_39361/m.95206 type:complete len:672 (+) Transcript_39361:121-2136(+)